jgi:hypothetical protein
MKNKKFYYIIFTIYALLISCSFQIINRKQVAWCIRQSNNNYILRISNYDTISYYLPENYQPLYNTLEDTLHFEGCLDDNFHTITKYYYNNQFKIPIISFHPIEGIKADSIETDRFKTIPHQFIPPKLIKLLPDSNIINSFKLTVPLNFKYVTIRIYKKKYPFDPQNDNSNYYNYANFVEFEKINSFVLTVKINDVR